MRLTRRTGVRAPGAAPPWVAPSPIPPRGTARSLWLKRKLSGFGLVLTEGRDSEGQCGMTKRDRALELRDLALAVLGARGAWRSVRVADASIQVLNFDGDGPSILYRTPFQQLSATHGNLQIRSTSCAA